ncbi:MAG: divalent-cation tolerance protein CutA [Vicinamibacteria bacterium]|nr:divalent-cation tolerance protein CutA [Vicinamibacteria bacterium]
MRRYVVVYCTAGDAEEAHKIARMLVERRLAACVNVVPSVTSHYRWKSEIARSDESWLVVKTREDRFEALRAAVVSAHSYEVPEIIALPIEAGNAPYLSWIDDCLE